MLIASLDDLAPIDYRAAFPDTSFTPEGPDDLFLAERGYVRVSLWKPYNSATEKLVQAAPYLEGGWVYTVQVEDKTAEELAADTAAAAVRVRAQRNGHLAACDWTQLADSPVDKEAWATYRQALRDVTAQPGFPNEVVWPETP